MTLVDSLFAVFVALPLAPSRVPLDMSHELSRIPRLRIFGVNACHPGATVIIIVLIVAVMIFDVGLVLRVLDRCAISTEFLLIFFRHWLTWFCRR